MTPLEVLSKHNLFGMRKFGMKEKAIVFYLSRSSTLLLEELVSPEEFAVPLSSFVEVDPVESSLVEDAKDP